MRASFEVFCARFAALRPVELKTGSHPNTRKPRVSAAPGPAARGRVILQTLYGTTPLLSRRYDHPNKPKRLLRTPVQVPDLSRGPKHAGIVNRNHILLHKLKKQGPTLRRDWGTLNPALSSGKQTNE